MKRILISILFISKIVFSQSFVEDLKRAIELGNPELYSELFVESEREN